MQLSLMSEREAVNVQPREYENTADTPHVRCLWTMSKEKRVLLWEKLQSQLQLRDLGLGGEIDGKRCVVDDEELAILCPHGSLHELQQLLLHTAIRLKDSGLRALALAGCGPQLTSLTLSCEFVLMILVPCVCVGGGDGERNGYSECVFAAPV